MLAEQSVCSNNVISRKRIPTLSAQVPVSVPLSTSLPTLHPTTKRIFPISPLTPLPYPTHSKSTSTTPQEQSTCTVLTLSRKPYTPFQYPPNTYHLKPRPNLLDLPQTPIPFRRKEIDEEKRDTHLPNTDHKARVQVLTPWP